jgi:hypothetical protein
MVKVIIAYFFPRLFPDEIPENVSVDAEENMESLVAKLRQSKKKTIWLVAPNSASILRQEESFQRLHEISQEQGLDLCLMSSDAAATSMAQSFGFKTLSTPAEKKS